MNIIDSVLTYSKPVEWEDASYSGRQYYLFDLQRGDEEYIEEEQAFRKGSGRLNITSLQRCQNPTRLGLFKIRKEQYGFRNETKLEAKYYHPINKEDLDISLKYNMDVRRYSHREHGMTNDNKNPLFYKTPEAAFNAISGTSKVIIICKILVSTYEASERCSKENDSEYYPIYVAEVKRV